MVTRPSRVLRLLWLVCTLAAYHSQWQPHSTHSCFSLIRPAHHTLSQPVHTHTQSHHSTPLYTTLHQMDNCGVVQLHKAPPRGTAGSCMRGTTTSRAPIARSTAGPATKCFPNWIGNFISGSIDADLWCGCHHTSRVAHSMLSQPPHSPPSHFRMCSFSLCTIHST